MPIPVYNQTEVDNLIAGVNTSIINTNTSLANLVTAVNDLKTRVTKLETPTTQAKAGLYVPLYTYPTSSTWNTVITTRQKYPSVPMIVAVNPSNGVGTQDTNYTNGINKLKAAGIKVIGYIYTQWADSTRPLYRTPSALKIEIDKWKSWYNVDGIFYDEMSTVVGKESFYKDLTDYVKAQGMTITMGNPGTDTKSSYIGTADILLTFESGRFPTDLELKPTWHTNYDKKNFGIIPYNVPFDANFIAKAVQAVGWIYTTNDGADGNAWNSLPTYFDQLVASLV